MNEVSLRTGLLIGGGAKSPKFAVSCRAYAAARGVRESICVKYYTFQASQNDAAVNAAHKAYRFLPADYRT